MDDFFRSTLQKAMTGAPLSADEMRRVIGTIMDGESDPLQTAGLLCVLAARGETAEEFAGAAESMRQRATRIREDGTGILDTCGTGGSGLRTFNISTAAAIICAAAGVSVAKHGNRSISSTSGSADVLETLSVNLTLSPEQVNSCIESIGIGFCYAPLLHSAMKNVGPIRSALGVRTIFNMLGPLTNPAGAEFQVLGTIRDSYAEKLAHALSHLGTSRALVVCGNNELDELCLWGPNTMFEVSGSHVTRHSLEPKSLGLPSVELADIQVDSAAESAELIQRTLAGDDLPARHAIAINAAAGLWIAGAADDLQAGLKAAYAVIDSGKAASKLQELQDLSQSLAAGK
ncbi:anthranilate phosphoribosyltransferase [bacterium]|nr:anthranilate phosphoribosyltransferase [bacterium]